MITVKTFPNMFVPMIKPTLRNANFNTVILCNTETPWGIDDSGCQ